MKLPPARVSAFLRDPGSLRVVLLFGEDVGMIRERAETLVRAVAGSLDDPFLVAELTRDQIRDLPNEAASMSLMGGRRVVRIREATDASADAVRTVLKGSAPALVVLEGGTLPSRSKLRTLLDADPDGVAIGCYPEEGRALEETIRGTLQAAGVAIDPDALSWLSGQLGSDRASTKAELEKLALFVGPGNRVDIDAAQSCVGDLAALAEGANAVQVLRTAMSHLQRLHRARLVMESAHVSAAEAAKTVRPPVFYQRVGAFNRALGLWTASALQAALAAMAEAERGCKRTGWPDRTLCRNAIITIARRSAALARR